VAQIGTPTWGIRLFDHSGPDDPSLLGPRFATPRWITKMGDPPDTNLHKANLREAALPDFQTHIGKRLAVGHALACVDISEEQSQVYCEINKSRYS